MPHTDTRPVRINSDVQRQFAAECKRRGFVIQDKATEALQDKIIEWQAEDEWVERHTVYAEGATDAD